MRAKVEVVYLSCPEVLFINLQDRDGRGGCKLNMIDKLILCEERKNQSDQKTVLKYRLQKHQLTDRLASLQEFLIKSSITSN